MRASIASTFVFLAAAVSAASSWGFSDASVQVVSKSAKEDSTFSFTDKQRLKDAVTLGSADKIKVSLTAKEGSKSKRPHQAFLLVKESTGLEAPYAFKVKESGKGTVEISQKDLPVQLLLSDEPLEASIVIASFGSSQGSITPAFAIDVQRDPNQSPPAYKAPLRYGKLEEIHHIFRDDPKSPPVVVSAVFALAVLATVPALFIGWLALGANVNHIGKALGTAPVSHVSFFGSIIAMEGVFFLYYSGSRLFTVLPLMGVVGLVAFLSGSRALGEVRSRRLAGER